MGVGMSVDESMAGASGNYALGSTGRDRGPVTFSGAAGMITIRVVGPREPADPRVAAPPRPP